MTKYEEYKNRILDIKYIFLNNQIDLIDYQYILTLVHESIYVVAEDLQNTVKMVLNSVQWPDNVQLNYSNDPEQPSTYLNLLMNIRDDLNSRDMITNDTKAKMINILNYLNTTILSSNSTNEVIDENDVNCVHNCSICQSNCTTNNNENIPQDEDLNDFSSNKEILNLSSLNKKYLKDYLLMNKILKNECAICGLVEWQNNYLKMELDYIDKDQTNQNINNIRLLCPNCFSQVGYNG